MARRGHQCKPSGFLLRCDCARLHGLRVACTKGVEVSQVLEANSQYCSMQLTSLSLCAPAQCSSLCPRFPSCRLQLQEIKGCRLQREELGRCRLRCEGLKTCRLLLEEFNSCRLQREELSQRRLQREGLGSTGYSCKELKAAGCSAKNVVDADCSTKGLRWLHNSHFLPQS